MVMRKFLIVFIIVVLHSLSFAGSQTVSSTTGTAMIALVRADYNDTTTNYFSAAEMLQFLNDGTQDIAVKTHCYQSTENISLVADTVEYSIVTDYIEIMGVKYNPASGAAIALKRGKQPLVGLTKEEFDKDTPVFWYEFGNKIGAYPALSAVTTETITLYVAKRPAAIAAGSAVPTPAIYDTALKYYMLARMALKDKNTGLYQSLMSQYDKELGFYRADLQEEAK